MPDRDHHSRGQLRRQDGRFRPMPWNAPKSPERPSPPATLTTTVIVSPLAGIGWQR